MRIDLDTAGSWAPAGANGGNPAPLFLDNGKYAPTKMTASVFQLDANIC